MKLAHVAQQALRPESLVIDCLGPLRSELDHRRSPPRWNWNRTTTESFTAGALRSRRRPGSIEPTDRIEWAGRTLEVIGEIARWPHPVRPHLVHHVEVDVQKVSG